MGKQVVASLPYSLFKLVELVDNILFHINHRGKRMVVIHTALHATRIPWQPLLVTGLFQNICLNYWDVFINSDMKMCYRCQRYNYQYSLPGFVSCLLKLKYNCRELDSIWRTFRKAAVIPHCLVFVDHFSKSFELIRLRKAFTKDHHDGIFRVFCI